MKKRKSIDGNKSESKTMEANLDSSDIPLDAHTMKDINKLNKEDSTTPVPSMALPSLIKK